MQLCFLSPTGTYIKVFFKNSEDESNAIEIVLD